EAALQDYRGKRDGTGPLCDTVVPAALLDGFRFHGGFEPGTFRECALADCDVAEGNPRKDGLGFKIHLKSENMQGRDGHQLASASAAMVCALVPLVSSARVIRI